MPGATTARLVFLAAAIAWKLFMMPQTVPKRPTKGDVEPTVARNGNIALDPSHLAPAVICITRSMRSCKVMRVAVVATMPLAMLRRHSRIAAAKTDDIGSSGRLPIRS